VETPKESPSDETIYKGLFLSLQKLVADLFVAKEGHGFASVKAEYDTLQKMREFVDKD